MIVPKRLHRPDRACWPVKMLSHRLSFIIAISAAIGILILPYTSRIGAWSGLD